MLFSFPGAALAPEVTWRLVVGTWLGRGGIALERVRPLRGVAPTPGDHLPIQGVLSPARLLDPTEVAVWCFLKAWPLSLLPAGASGT